MHFLERCEKVSNLIISAIISCKLFLVFKLEPGATIRVGTQGRRRELIVLDVISQDGELMHTLCTLNQLTFS